MNVKESKLIAGREKHTDPPDDYRKRLDNIKRLKNPRCFTCDGVTVRVSFEGTADLNELMKGLFLTG